MKFSNQSAPLLRRAERSICDAGNQTLERLPVIAARRFRLVCLGPEGIKKPSGDLRSEGSCLWNLLLLGLTLEAPPEPCRDQPRTAAWSARDCALSYRRLCAMHLSPLLVRQRRVRFRWAKAKTWRLLCAHASRKSSTDWHPGRELNADLPIQSRRFYR
jgi:hypothetical protein